VISTGDGQRLAAGDRRDFCALAVLHLYLGPIQCHRSHSFSPIRQRARSLGGSSLDLLVGAADALVGHDYPAGAAPQQSTRHAVDTTSGRAQNKSDMRQSAVITETIVPLLGVAVIASLVKQSQVALSSAGQNELSRARSHPLGLNDLWFGQRRKQLP